MKKFKFSKFYWSKLLTIILFVLLVGGYSNVFAVYTPEEILYSSCPREEVSCILKTSISILFKGLATSTVITLEKIKTTTVNSFNTTKQLGSSLTASAFTSLKAGGNSLTSVSDGLADGWISFTQGILNNIKDSVTGTKEFVNSVGDGAQFVGNEIADGLASLKLSAKAGFTSLKEGWNSTKKFVIVKSPIVIPPALTTTAPTTKVEVPVPTTAGSSVAGTTIIQRIYEQPQTTIINQYDPTIFPRIQGIELALQNSITRDSRQTERTYDSVSRSIYGATENITEDGILNDTTLNRPIINNAVITTSTFSGTSGIYTGDVSALTFNGNTFTTGTGILTIGAGKTLIINNSIALTGTDSTTMTFPTTSATLARTDAGQTFTGVNIFTSPTFTTSITPTINDGTAIGTTALQFSDLFLAEGGIINWDNGDVTLTQTGNELALAGGNLALGSNSLTMSGSIADTTNRVLKGWFTDAEFTNVPTIGGNALGTIYAGVGQTFYIGTTQVAINRATNPLTLAGITLTTPELGSATGTSLDLGTTTLYASRAITVDTGGVFNIDIGSASGDDFTVDTSKFVVEGDTGYVGIGTTGPNNHLQITDDNANGQIRLSGSTVTHYWDIGREGQVSGRFAFINAAGGAATEKMSILTNGNVGIGTVVPSGILSVTPTQYSTGTASQSLTTVTGVGTTFTSAMVGSQFVFANGTTAGTITAFGSITSLTVSTSQTVASQAYNIAYTGLQVATTGNVGIGTTSPGLKLDVAGEMVFTNGTNSSHADWSSFNRGLMFPSTSGGSSNPGALITYTQGNNWGDNIIFATRSNNGGSGVERMRITSDGNVGIGTTAPRTSENLTVMGATTAISSSNPVNLGVFASDSMAIDKGGSIGLGGSLTGTTPTVFGYIWGRKENATNDNRNGYLAFGTAVEGAPWANEWMRITSAGNVGIGTTSPGAKLDVSGSFTASGVARFTGGNIGDVNTTPVAIPNNKLIKFERAADTNWAGVIGAGTNDVLAISGVGGILFGTGSSATERVRIDSTGNVGIGTAGPLSKLDISGATAPVTTFSYYPASTQIASGDSIGGISFRGSDANITGGIGGTDGEGAKILAAADGDWQSLVEAPTRLSFYTHGTATGAPTERMRITSTGNIGIGTTGPTSPLHVAKDFVGWAGDIVNTRSADADGHGLIIRTNSVSATNVALGVYNTAVSAYRFVIRGDGNVGIGTTAPANILTVLQTSATDPIADAWTVYSSGRWKENRVPIVNALETINKLNPVYFDWKAEYGGAHDLGFIAEEIGLIIPEVVAWEANGVDAKSIDYSRLSTIAIAGIKEMNLKVESINDMEIENDWRDSITAWLANAGNKITRIFTGEICLTDPGQPAECINRTELKSLKALILDSVNTGGSSGSSGETPDTSSADSAPSASQPTACTDTQTLVDNVCVDNEVVENPVVEPVLEETPPVEEPVVEEIPEPVIEPESVAEPEPAPAPAETPAP